MPTLPLTILVVGATGSVGRLVVEEALVEGHTVGALLRGPAKAHRLPSGITVVVGDLTKPAALGAAVAGLDAIVFTHGSNAGDKSIVESVDYGGVRNVL